MPNRREFMLGMAAGGIGLSQVRLPAEWKAYSDPETGRKIRQLTSAPPTIIRSTISVLR